VKIRFIRFIEYLLKIQHQHQDFNIKPVSSICPFVAGQQRFYVYYLAITGVTARYCRFIDINNNGLYEQMINNAICRDAGAAANSGLPLSADL
jgi:hypothetical protein